VKLSVEVPGGLLSSFKLAIDATILNLDSPDLTDDEASVMQILREWVGTIPENEDKS